MSIETFMIMSEVSCIVVWVKIPQVHTRQHLGLLEKHRDYVLRAKDYQRKKAQLKHMHEKVSIRNLTSAHVLYSVGILSGTESKSWRILLQDGQN